MRKVAVVVSAAVVLAGIGLAVRHRTVVQARPAAQAGTVSPGQALSPAELDGLLAPIALYPDALLAQMLMCAGDPAGVKALDQFLKSHATLKGTDLQDAALKDNFQPSFVALSIFPQVVQQMASQLDSTTRLGQAFTADRTSVFASIQRLRKQAHDAGTLKTTPQQEVETQTTSTGQQVIVIEPSNPQVVYVPQYNPQTVYVVQPATTVVVQQTTSTDAAVAGVIGFTAGIAIGAAVNNNYYYGPYGWHGGGYMYNDAWDDYYDHREDAREDWQDHREDLADERGDRAQNAQEQRTDRQENRTENRPESQAQRTERQQTRQENRPESQGQRSTTTAQTASSGTRGSGSYESRGNSSTQPRGADRDAGTKRDGLERVLGLFEREVGTCREHARAEQPKQLVALQKRRGRGREAPVMTRQPLSRCGAVRSLTAVALTCLALTAHSLVAAQGSAQRTFTTPEAAVRALIEAAKAANADELRAIFGPDGQELVDSSDAATGRRNLEVFTVAAAEGWRLLDQQGNRKGLIVGNEGWPFPVPLVKKGNSWRFDSAAGREEVLARRIGRNELAVIGICRAYVAAQHRYAQLGHDGKPAGLFATTFGSDPGKQNGLYWQAARGQPLSPLGDLVAQASAEGRPIGTNREGPSPFHGYYFKILTAQGPAAPGGAKSYVVNGQMSAGFALVAWPAQYDATGIMTFAVNQDGIIHETDLGAKTGVTAAAMTTYNPDKIWRPVR